MAGRENGSKSVRPLLASLCLKNHGQCSDKDEGIFSEET